ncbi:MAG: VOC family protein [Haloplanus sp.]
MTGHVGRVALRVTDLDRMVEFYERVIGLRVVRRADDQAILGVDDPLLCLRADPDAAARGPAETGLYHTAFRVPSEAALGDAIHRIESRWRLDGASDHRVSEALYLTDPEDNGVEVYRDYPQSAWPIAADGTVEMDTLALALDPLREAAAGDDRCPSGTTVGHVHLEVSSLSAARAFYVDGLGLRVRASMPSALFLATDDGRDRESPASDREQSGDQVPERSRPRLYHHHIGCNTWQGRSEPSTGRGLAWVELFVDDPAAARSRLDTSVTETRDGFTVTDPDGIELRVRRA